MKQIKILTLLFVGLLLSCGVNYDDAVDTTPNVVVTTADADFNIAENASVGTTIGTVTGTSNNGSVTFAIANQTPDGAIAIDASSGELTVASALNRNENPELNATITVSNGDVSRDANVTVTVDLPPGCVDMAKWMGDITLVDGSFRNENMTVVGSTGECNTLSVTGIGFAFGDCEDEATIDLTLTPSDNDPNVGTVTFELSEVPCGGFFDTVNITSVDVGTYDVNSGLIEISYRTEDEGFVIDEFERIVVGIGGEVPINPDSDFDGIDDEQDNCPETVNPEQLDSDEDGMGDLCDPDDDNDGVNDELDNCPLTANEDQADMDGDGLGDVCDDVVDAPCTSTVNTSVWTGFLDGVDNTFGDAEPVDRIISRPGCGLLRIEGDITGVFATPTTAFELIMTPASDGATNGTIAVPEVITSDEVGEIAISGSGTYDETTGEIFLDLEVDADGFVDTVQLLWIPAM